MPVSLPIRKISTLSLPRSSKFLCEICSMSASFACTECATYYCSEEHFMIDWDGIRKFILSESRQLLQVQDVGNSEDEREKKKMDLLLLKENVRNTSIEKSKEFLIKGSFELATAGALQSLKIAVDLFGIESVDLTISYLLLAESNFGLKRLSVAEDFLMMASSNLIKNPKSGGIFMSSLQRNLGRLYLAQGKIQESSHSFAGDVYFSSLRFGPDNIRTAPSYYYMGETFLKSGNRDAAGNFFSTVLGIYFDELVRRGKAGELSPVENQECVEILKNISIFFKDKKLALADAHCSLWCLSSSLTDAGILRGGLELALLLYSEVLGESHEKYLVAKNLIQTSKS